MKFLNYDQYMFEKVKHIFIMYVLNYKICNFFKLSLFEIASEELDYIVCFGYLVIVLSIRSLSYP